MPSAQLHHWPPPPSPPSQYAGLPARLDPGDDVVGDQAVAGPVGGRVAVRAGQRRLEADRVDADVVVVVDAVAGDGPAVDVAVDDDALAGAEVQVVDLVVPDRQARDRRVRVVAVRRDAVGVDVEAAQRAVVVAQVVHVVADDRDRRVVPVDVDAGRHVVELVGAVAGHARARAPSPRVLSAISTRAVSPVGGVRPAPLRIGCSRRYGASVMPRTPTRCTRWW